MAKRNKIELIGMVERVVDLYSAGKTCQEIERVLRDEGHDVSRESIRRSIKTSKKAAQVYKKSLDEARILIHEVQQGANTEMLETTTSLLASKIFEVVRSLDGIEFENIGELVDAVKKISQAQVPIAKLRLQYQKGVDAAKRTIMAELQHELKEHPNILKQIGSIVHQVQVDEK